MLSRSCIRLNVYFYCDPRAKRCDYGNTLSTKTHRNRLVRYVFSENTTAIIIFT